MYLKVDHLRKELVKVSFHSIHVGLIGGTNLHVGVVKKPAD